MATGWGGAENLVPLGSLIAERYEFTPEIVNDNSNVEAPACRPMTRVRALPRPRASEALFKTVPPAHKPEPRKIVITDAVLTPSAELRLAAIQMRFENGAAHEIWKVAGAPVKPANSELQAPPASRRIWTRELLTLHQSLLGDSEFIKAFPAPDDAHPPESPELIAQEEFQPREAFVPRLTIKELDNPGEVKLTSVQAPGEERVTSNLIGARIKVQFDLQPLSASSRRRNPST